MAKEIIYGEEARRKLKNGVDQLARAVSTTLGPRGRNVTLKRLYGTPQVVHDGVTVAKEVVLKDPFEDAGAQLVREAASQTNDAAGDGTTTATVLTQSIVDEGLRNISAGVNPMSIRKGLENATLLCLETLKEIARPIKEKDEKFQVARVSAQNDEIGRLIADAMEKVGDDGVIAIEESNGLEMGLDYKDGMQFEKGYISPYFVNNTDRGIVEIDKPHILVCGDIISNAQELLPALQTYVNEIGGNNIVVIADDVEKEALGALILNKVKGTLNTVAIKAPAFGDTKKAILEDIAVLTGATLISKEMGNRLDSITVEDFGLADKVTVTHDTTTIVGGKGSEEDINVRVENIKTLIEKEKSEYEKDKLRKRLAKLTTGVAVIQVGAASEAELIEKKLRVEDAVNATKAAVEEGIVPGGGTVLLKLQTILRGHDFPEDEKLGAKILERALQRPAELLVENAGYNAGEILGDLRRNYIQEKELNDTHGFDVTTGEFVDMIDRGIIDPVKVTRSAIQNAVSAAVMILTTDCIIVDEEKEEK